MCWLFPDNLNMHCTVKMWIPCFYIAYKLVSCCTVDISLNIYYYYLYKL